MWPVTFYKRIPSIPPLPEVEAQLASTVCAGESPAQPIPSRSLSRRAKARGDVSAGCSRVESLLDRNAVNEEVEREAVGSEGDAREGALEASPWERGACRRARVRGENGIREGAQQVGTVRGLGGMKGNIDRGRRRWLAERSNEAVVKVIAKATANRS